MPGSQAQAIHGTCRSGDRHHGMLLPAGGNEPRADAPNSGLLTRYYVRNSARGLPVEPETEPRAHAPACPTNSPLLYSSLSSRPQEEDWDGGVVDDFLRDASQYQAAEAAPAVRRHRQ